MRGARVDDFLDQALMREKSSSMIEAKPAPAKKHRSPFSLFPSAERGDVDCTCMLT